MSKHTQYALQGAPPRWKVLKFERGEYITTYDVGLAGDNLFCDCFAGNKPTCRHRQMIALFGIKPSGWLYNFDLKEWQPPQDIE